MNNSQIRVSIALLQRALEKSEYKGLTILQDKVILVETAWNWVEGINNVSERLQADLEEPYL